jgi:hypothetical protein
VNGAPPDAERVRPALAERHKRLLINGAGHAPGGYRAEHGRWLSYLEEKFGARPRCVRVNPEREPEYWASHWRKLAERR